MSSLDEREIILEHALGNQENLETTLDIGLAFPALRERIIIDFLGKLEKFVLGKLKQRPDASEWHVSDDSLPSFPSKKFHSFSFGKQTWEKKYGVALEPQENNAGNVIIGVCGQYDEETGTGARKIDLLFQKLNDIRNGKRSDWWEWYHLLDDPYRNWGTKDGLIELNLREDNSVTYLGQYFVNIIEVAAPIIDEHVQES